MVRTRGTFIPRPILVILLPLLVAAFVAIRVADRQPAPSLDQVATIDLADSAHDAAVLARFSLRAPAEVELRFTLNQVETARFDLSIAETAGARYSIVRATAFRTDEHGGGAWRQLLPAGDYRVLLSAAQGSGIVTIHIVETPELIFTSAATSAEHVRFTSALPPANTLDQAHVAAFFDETLPRQLSDYHIPGAALALVKDGRLVYAAGYGYADLEREQAASAARTLFRTGSAAKLFTWTAVMQLVEQGKLDLDADVNHYLPDFAIPATYPEPITLAHLLTHTAGFEDSSNGAMRATPADLEPLGSYLADHMPARVFPPGQVTAYSNYGAALAGYIVEQVSGQPFEIYVQQHLFAPLNMAHTTFAQPPAAPLNADLATGYAYTNNTWQAQAFEVYEIAPAGSASASAEDMARFMLAHLEQGAYGDQRILQPQTVRLMQQRHFSNAAELAGLAYGFYELRLNGRRLLTHAGDTGFFRSQLFLLPEERLGLYIVYNAPGGGAARAELAQAFFDRFYPARDITHPRPSGDGATIPLSGRYLPTRSAQTTVDKLRLLFDPTIQPLTVRVLADGALETIHPLERSRNPAAYQPRRWTPIGAGVFQQSDGRDLALFRTDPQGNLMLFLDSVPLRGHRKLAWFEEALFEPFVAPGALLVILAASGWAAFDRRARPAARRLMLLNGGVTALFALGLAGFALFGFSAYLYGEIAPLWRIVFALPIALIPLGGALAAATALPWPGTQPARRLPYALAILALTALLLWSNYWNVLGWRF